MGGRERRWVECISANQSNTTSALLCGLSQDMTPEQQVAVACAAKTGGEPRAFAVCTGGQLMAREIDKCWNGGIGTQQGCFGPNKEIYKYWNSMDGALRQALGPSNDLYKTFVFFKNNLFVPSASHDLVRAANTAMNDLRNGPGPNNDVVKAVNVVVQGLQSIGSVFGF